jgi:hypothetical protein
MDFRHINVTEMDLKGNKSKVQSYIFLDKMPPNEYKVMMMDIEKQPFNLDNMTVSLSNKEGDFLLKLNKKPSIEKSFYHMLELELRGALVEINDGVLTLNENYTPVLHTGFHCFAASLYPSDIKLGFEVANLIEHVIENSEIISKVEVVSGDFDNTAFPCVTRYMTKEKELKKFYKEVQDDKWITNILTGVVTFEQVKKEMENRDLF